MKRSLGSWVAVPARLVALPFISSLSLSQEFKVLGLPRDRDPSRAANGGAENGAGEKSIALLFVSGNTDPAE